MTQRVKLKEHALSEGLSVDREAGVIRGVRVLGSDSKNGRRYTDKAMGEARELYEGRRVNLDHPSPQNAATDRPVVDTFGVLKDCRIKEGAVFADLHYLSSHPYAEFLLERAEKMPETFGLSHNADGIVSPQKDGTLIVESVVEVYSVDLVGTPATNSGLFESVAAKEPKPMKAITLLRKNARHPVADRLLKLFEQEGEAPEAAEAVAMDAEVAAEEVAAVEEASPEEQVDMAFKAMVLKIVEDSSLDAAAKIEKIGALLTKQEEVQAAVADAGAEAGGGSEEVAESARILRRMSRKLDRLEKRDTARSLLEEHGLLGIDADRRALLEQQADETAMLALIESWPPSVRRAAKPKVGRAAQKGSGGYRSLTEGLKRD